MTADAYARMATARAVAIVPTSPFLYGGMWSGAFVPYGPYPSWQVVFRKPPDPSWTDSSHSSPQRASSRRSGTPLLDSGMFVSSEVGAKSLYASSNQNNALVSDAL